MEKALLSSALDAVSSAIIIVHKSRKVVFFNKSLSDLFKPQKGVFTVGNCINCADRPNDCECGEGKNCKLCFLNMYLCEAITGNKAIANKYLDKKISCGNEIKKYRFKLNIKPIEDEYFCCIMQDITEYSDTIVKHYNKRLNMDFQRAKTIQSLLLPSFDKLKPLADFVYYYRQNFLVGGDLFDVYKHNNGCYGGYIADISGLGISAGMLTVIMHENFPQSFFSPAEAMKSFADKFNMLNLSEESYITALAFSVDTANKKLYVCNAGHSIPAIIKKKDSLKIIYVRGNTVSNWYDGVTYCDSVFDYSEGDMLILMTDGIPDLKNGEGEYYSFDRVKAVAERSSHSMTEILRNVEIDIINFCNGVVPKDTDDKAVLIIELK